MAAARHEHISNDTILMDCPKLRMTQLLIRLTLNDAANVIFFALTTTKRRNAISKIIVNFVGCYETGAHHIILLAADRRIGGTEVGEVRQVPAVGGMAAGDLYSGKS
jgi:hypothetical protein